MTTTQPQPESPSDRSTTFQPVEGSPTEQYSGTTLLVVAYSALWVVLFAWVALVWRKQSALRARLDDLDRVLDKAADDAERGSAEKSK
jgi:CcmD family protein